MKQKKDIIVYFLFSTATSRTPAAFLSFVDIDFGIKSMWES